MLNHSLRDLGRPSLTPGSGTSRQADPFAPLCLVASQPRANTPCLATTNTTPFNHEREREVHPSHAHTGLRHSHEPGIAVLPLSPLLSTPEIPHQQAKRPVIPYRLSGQRATRLPNEAATRHASAAGGRDPLPSLRPLIAGTDPCLARGKARRMAEPKPRAASSPALGRHPALRGNMRTPRSCDSHQSIRDSTETLLPR